MAESDIWAIVPVKGFHLAKQRLKQVYSPELRYELAQVMLEDVLDTLTQVADIAGVAVVTSDREAGKLARTYGAAIFDEEAGHGLNEAILSASRRLVREGRGGMLTIAGDVPGITLPEVEAVLAMHRYHAGLTLVPAHDRRGTNAMLMTPPDAMSPAFGENSFTQHFLTGSSLGLEPTVLSLPGIGLDLDYPEDITTFCQTASPTRTWRYLLSCGLAASCPANGNTEEMGARNIVPCIGTATHSVPSQRIPSETHDHDRSPFLFHQ